MQVIKKHSDLKIKFSLPDDILRFYQNYEVLGNIGLIFDNLKGHGYGNQITKFLYFDDSRHDYYRNTEDIYSNDWEEDKSEVLDYFPFAETLGASSLLISKTNGKIYGYVWEIGIHETVNNPDYLIANSFTEFLEKLIKDNNIQDKDFLEMYDVVRG